MISIIFFRPLAFDAIQAAGFPVYYIEDDTPEGLLIKEYPDGHRELVRFNETGDEVIKIL
nr:hypothetical protein [Zymomonas mobilis]